MRDFWADFSFERYGRIYAGYYNDFWDTMGPMEYGILLVSVGVAGILLMRSSR